MNKKKQIKIKSWIWVAAMLFMISPMLKDLNYPNTNVAFGIGGLFVVMVIAGLEVIGRYGR